MRSKRGWLRILEATISILLISSVLLVVYSRNVQEVDMTETIYSLQREVLLDISLSTTLRQMVLNDPPLESNLEAYAATKIPDSYDFQIRVCPLGEACGLRVEDLIATRDKNVYVEDQVIAGEYDEYDPQKVRLFIWEAG